MHPGFALATDREPFWVSVDLCGPPDEHVEHRAGNRRSYVGAWPPNTADVLLLAFKGFGKDASVNWRVVTEESADEGPSISRC